MTYDRSDAREARRNALAIELADVRRKLGDRARAGAKPSATWPIVSSVALLAISPILVGVARQGPQRAWHDVQHAARAWALETETGRELFDTAPVVDEASETITMGAARVTLGGHDEDGDALTVIIVRRPSSGTLTRLDGTPIEDRVAESDALYVPDPGFVGEDEFAIAVDDGTLRSATSRRRLRVYAPTVAPELLPRATPEEGMSPARSRRALTSAQITTEYLLRRERAFETDPSSPREPTRSVLLPPIVTNADLEAGRGQ